MAADEEVLSGAGDESMTIVRDPPYTDALRWGG